MINVLLYDTGDARNENNEPLGIEVIGARILKEFNTEVNVRLLWYNRDGIPQDLDENLDVIGISLNIKQIEVFDNVYQKIKAMHHKPLLFVGNVVATYGYEHLLKKYRDIICMIGEGEEIYVQIINSIFNNSFVPDKINNLAFWNGEKVVTTERKVADLSCYVNPIRAFNTYIVENKGIARIEGSRGCAWRRCDFCCINYKYDSAAWRGIDTEKIIEQIEELASAGIKSIYFTDEDFVGNDILHLKGLVEGIERQKKYNQVFQEVNFFISIKPTDVLNKEIFQLLQRFSDNGLREIFIGIESGCKNQLKRYNKCTTKKINEQVLEKVRELDIDIDLGFILFDPEITIEELEENISFIEKFEIYNWGPNFIKRLRIQSFTEYEQKLCALELEFDLNNLEYIYQFKDSKIQKIYDLYSRISFDDYAYQLQNVYRGEIETEEMRLEQKERIVSLRKVQFLCLKRIVQSVVLEEELYLDDILSEFHYNNCLKDERNL